MKEMIYVLGLLCLGLACQSKERDALQNPESKPAERLEIKIILEDQIYQIEDDWYSWGPKYEACSPQFFLAYRIPERFFELKYCPSLGQVDLNSFQLANGLCDTGLKKAQRLETSGEVLVQIPVSEDFNHCLTEVDDIVSLTFLFHQP